MSRTLRAILVTLSFVIALLAGAALNFAVLGSEGVPDPGLLSFRGSILWQGWTAVREGALQFVDRLLDGIMSVPSRLSEVWESTTDLITTAIARQRARIIAFGSASESGPAGASTSESAQVVAGTGVLRVDLTARGPLAMSELTGDMKGGQRPVLRIKTGEERRVEQLIEKAFHEYFREYTITGKRLAVRMPFALNEEREGGHGYAQAFYKEGKGRPEELWPYIDKVLASREFARYAAEMTSPGEKAVVFNLARRLYWVSRNRQLIDALGMDAYPGTPTRIFVRRSETGLTEADLYNYLYAVAAVGVDCSGFAYHVQAEVAKAYALDLDELLAKDLMTSPREVRAKVGLRFFDPASGHTEVVGDRVLDLRPGDLILFRGSEGELKHSAVIQSVDFRKGIIRYVQSTDWAPEAERGVHLSVIRFDPERAGESLRHYSVRWLQQVRPPFEGEEEPREWLTDGDRYLWYTVDGGSLVVRPRYLSAVLLAAEPRFYTNIGADEEFTGTREAGAAGSPATPPRQIAR
jgi:hypothetical protein